MNVSSVLLLTKLLLSRLCMSLLLLLLEHAEDHFLFYFCFYFFFNINKTILQLLDSEQKLQISIQNTNRTLNDKVIFYSSPFFYYAV